MKTTRYLVCLFLVSVGEIACGESPLTSAREITAFGKLAGKAERQFDVSAKVISPAVVPMRIFFARVDDQIFTFGVNRKIVHLSPTNVGERVRLKGLFRRLSVGNFTMDCRSIESLGLEPPDQPMSITAQQLYGEKTPLRLVSISGTIRDIRPDEIDPNFNFLTLNCNGEIVYAALCVADADPQHLAELPGADVTAVGLLSPCFKGHRRLMGKSLFVAHASGITINTHGTEDIFSVPDVASVQFDRPSDLLSFGRCRAVGTVLAVWSSSTVLLKTDDGALIRLNLRSDVPPKRGMRIEASGFPETNFSHLSLTGASWRRMSELPMYDETPQVVSAQDIFLDESGRSRLHPELHGRTIRINGIIITQPQDGVFTLSVNNQVLLVDASALSPAFDGLAVKSIIEATGICIMDAENWKPDFTFPHIHTVRIVPRTPADIRVLHQPPWWTPPRVAAVIGSLLLLLVVILIWNLTLRRLAAQRGRELAAKTIAQAESELKVYERTRLATELHDSLAQILTGVAFKLETADRLAETNPTAMRKHLGIAIRSLQACRDDLRNCLWDLRNHALEIPDMDKAIRRTLEQHLEGTALVIRFNVPRERLSDNTTHEILCIIRELVLNAIRHGHATEVRVAGAIEDETLRFSVSDNGCGFDPNICPGMREGHYGLQGVRERAAHLDGEFTIRTNGTSGMKAVVSIKIPHTT